MNIFLRELRANLKSLLIWGGIVILLIIMAIAKFTGVRRRPGDDRRCSTRCPPRCSTRSACARST